MRCVHHRVLVSRSLCSKGSAPTLHALVWRCRHIFSPPAEPKKRAPPVSTKGHCHAYRTGLQLHWWSTEEENHWVKERSTPWKYADRHESHIFVLKSIFKTTAALCVTSSFWSLVLLPHDVWAASPLSSWNQSAHKWDCTSGSLLLCSHPETPFWRCVQQSWPVSCSS